MARKVPLGSCAPTVTVMPLTNARMYSSVVVTRFPLPTWLTTATRQGNCFGNSGRVSQEGSNCGASGRALVENNDAYVTPAG
jgi:hypothetical protein